MSIWKNNLSIMDEHKCKCAICGMRAPCHLMGEYENGKDENGYTRLDKMCGICGEGKVSLQYLLNSKTDPKPL